MAGHELIDDHLRALAERLPAHVVDELADGLTASYEDRLERLGDPRTAARAAIADFGDPDTVTAAFVSASPGRGAARRLLLTGPLVGASWAIMFVANHAWTWQVPAGARLLLGTLLALVVLTLLVAARESRRYRTVRLAALTGVTILLLLDITMLAAITGILTTPVWPPPAAASVLPAMAASVARTVLLTRTLPSLLGR